MAFSYFFRDMPALKCGIQTLKQHFEEHSTIKIWNPGCAYGQESFSIAMLIADVYGGKMLDKTEIFASDVDISNRFYKYFKLPKYSESDIKRIPAEFKSFFVTANGFSYVKQKIAKTVVYEKHDLLSFKAAVTKQNAIVCKNCLMHFSADEKSEVLKMFCKCLVPKGVLVIGQNQDIENSNWHKFFYKSESNSLVLIKK